MNLPFSLNDQGTLLLALGIGAVLGILFGGWIMSAVHKLLMGIVKIVLLGAMVVLGLFLWKHFQAPEQPRQTPSPIPTQTTETTNYETAPARPSDRWWEE